MTRDKKQQALDSPRGKRGLDALRELRQRVPASSLSGRIARKQKTLPQPDATSDEAESAQDAALFSQAMRDVAPLPDPGLAQLDTPRPAPVPRRKTEAELAIEAMPDTPRPSAAPRTDADLFRAWMDDVTPLAGHERAELNAPRSAPVRSGTRHADGASDKPVTAPALPPGSETLDDSELFHHVMRSAKPLEGTDRVELQTEPPAPTPVKRHEDDKAVLRDSLEAPLTLEDRLDMGEETAFLRTGLPRRVLTDLRRGRWVLQGELDLHGFKRDEAREELARFLAQALRQGHRCVRVIHGKGLGSPGRVSILKQLSRGWLAQREEILAFCQAGPNQGGSGALMVLLRGRQAPRSG